MSGPWSATGAGRQRLEGGERITRWQLRPDVHIGVEWDDRTLFGSPVGDRTDWAVRELYAPIVEHVRANGYAALNDGIVVELFEQVVRSEAFRQVTEPDGAGAWRIRPEYLYPDVSRARPAAIGLMRVDTGRHVRAGLPADYWPRVHAAIADLAGDGCDDAVPTLHPDLRSMLDAMAREGLIEKAGRRPAPDPRQAESDFTFVGHNTVVVRSRTTRVVVDPLLFATGNTYPADYQPLLLHDLGPIDAVLITHSHRDHFDAASLLRFPPDTPVIVPRVERETVLAIAMERRLRELGFDHIQVMDWGQSTLVGDIEVHALPFYGEQPTEGDVLHPAERNIGNTYLIRTPSFSASFLADSGRDAQGNVKDLATRTRASLGPVDVVFSGYRGWLIYPAQFIFSSVARFVPFIPPWMWTVRQQIMTTADEALDIAERWGARYLVPYADGGAPWHWHIDLGPRLDEGARELAGFDPFPERVLEAARVRTQTPDNSTLASPVKVLLMRPGESVQGAGTGAADIVRHPGHVWPFAERLAAQEPPP